MLKTIKLNGLKLKGNLLAAPMAGYTNFPTRVILQKYGADLTFTEMVSANGIVHNNKKTLDLLISNKNETAKAVQIFGDDKYIIKDAIDYIQENTDYKIINLNAGCPAKKILKSKKGGWLLKDTEKLKDILEYINDKIKICFTLKIRSGWDQDNINYNYIGKLAEDNNCKMIILHPRTVKQGFSGKADWDQVYHLKKLVKIPVIGNGDIFSPEDAFNIMKKGDIDGIMVGRGAIGSPWIFKNIKDYIKKKKYAVTNNQKKINIMLEHLSGMIDFFGERKGIIIFRAQMFQYIKNFDNSAVIRRKIQSLENALDIKNILLNYNLI